MIQYTFVDVHSSKAKQFYEKYIPYHELSNFNQSVGFCAIDDDNNFLGYILIWKFQVLPFNEDESTNIKGNLILPIKVEEEYRGNGLGNDLLNKAIGEYDADLLFVDINNSVAISLYEKYDFHVSDVIETEDGKQYIMQRIKGE